MNVDPRLSSASAPPEPSRAALEDAVTRLESALRLAGLGTWSVDLRTQLGTHDDVTAAMLGAEAGGDAAVMTLWQRVLHPDDRESAAEAFRSTVAAALAAAHHPDAALDADALRYEIELRVLRPDGVERRLALSARVVCDSRRAPERVVGVVRDVTEERLAAGEREALLAREQRTRSAIERVHAITASLAAARTQAEVIATTLRAQREAVGASRTSIWLVDGDGLARVGTDDAPGIYVPLISQTSRIPLDGSSPARLAAATGESIFLPTAEEIGRRFPALGTGAGKDASQALAALPLVVDDRIIGTITCSWPTPHPIGPDEQALLGTIASQCAQAIDRVQSDEAERRARAAAERERDRTLQLQTAVAALALPLSPAGVVDALLTQSLAQLGAYAGSVFELSDDGADFVLLHSVGLDPDVAARFARFPVDRPLPSRDVVRERAPIFLATPDEWRARYDPAAVGERSGAWAALPLVADDRMLGILTLSFSAPRAFDDDDRAFFVALAQQGAQALARARLYEAERRARAEAAAANRAKMNFLAAMSHELRTPLNAISGYAQLLEMGLRGPVTPQQAADLASIQRNQRHLMSLVEDVLRYAKLEAGRTVFDLAPVDLHAIVADVVEMMAPLAAERRLTLTAAERIDAVAWADREKVRQILVNLVSNAVKFTPAGGGVSIAAETHERGVRVDVRDTGPGIPRDAHDHVFEPFVQLGDVGAGRQEGVGLGLAISRDLARGMGGELVVTDHAASGAWFTLTLPRTAPSDESA